MRTMRQSDRMEGSIGSSVWRELDELEKTILTYMGSKKEIRRVELETLTGKAGRTITVRLNHLIELGIIKRNGNKNDPKQTYELI